MKTSGSKDWPVRGRTVPTKLAALLALSLTLLVVSTSLLRSKVSRITSSCEDEKAGTNTRETFELTSSEKNFFFLETAGSQCLDGRQSCSIESAARKNTDFVIVLVTLWKMENCSYLEHLKRLPNFKVVRVNLADMFKDTAVDSWYRGDSWIDGPFRTNHLSDALRLVMLWKYGGIYADLDVLVLRSFEGLGNCVSRELFPAIGNSVMKFRKGHLFLLKCLREFAMTYRSRKWAHNGPRLLERVLRRLCPKAPLMKEPYVNCTDVSVLPGEAFYPVPYTQWNAAFERAQARKVLQALSDSYAVHLWNSYSKSTAAESGSAYDVLRKFLCPTTHAMSKRFLNLGS